MQFNLFTDEDLKKGSNVIIMVGPPGCGKSTVTKEFVNSRPPEEQWVIICPDDIRIEISGDINDQSHNNEVFGKVYSRFITFLKNGCNIVYDATNCRVSHRYKVLNTIDGYFNKLICFMSTKSLLECLKNNINSDRHVPNEAIERMYMNLKNHPPTLFEGYDAIVKF